MIALARRTFMAGAAALLSSPVLALPKGENEMYGLIGKMRATPGEREALIAILLDGTDAMPGCLSYIVAKDPSDADAIWITEVWDSEASHKASLQLPAVQAAIAKGRPIIADFDSHIATEPVGGHGLNG